MSSSESRRISFQRYSEDKLEQARNEHRPAVLMFDAQWCDSCRAMDAITFRDPEVVKATAGFVLLKADLTHSGATTDRLRNEFGVESMPTTLFIDANGKIVRHVSGLLGPSQFLHYLQQVG